MFRKPINKDETFILSEEAESRQWCISALLTDQSHITLMIMMTYQKSMQ